MKNEFVMVRRNVLADACSFDDGVRLSAQHAIEAVLAEQHQGDPVALPARKPGVNASFEGTDAEWYGNIGWNACLDEIAKLGPLHTRPAQGEPVAWTYLVGGERRFFPTDPRPSHGAHAHLITEAQPVYTHADPAEVERLEVLIGDIQGLRLKTEYQLAERGALLREVLMAFKPGKTATLEEFSALMDKVRLSLSASAEPSTPVERDERAAFERYECEDPDGPQVDPMWMLRCTLDPEKYGILSVQSDWESWKARAALERKP